MYSYPVSGLVAAPPGDAARRHLAHLEKLMALLSTADWPGNRQGTAGAFSRTPALLARQIAQIRTHWLQRGVALWTYPDQRPDRCVEKRRVLFMTNM